MRIVQISDSHISRNHPARALELESCIRTINAMRPQPDVVVHTGDIAHDGLAEEYAIARRLLDGLSAPWFVIPGNRDNRSELIRAFADDRHVRDDMEFIQYAVDHFDVRMIFIDTVDEGRNKGRLCQARLSQIDRLLADDPTRPAVVFMHHPPFQVDVVPDPFQFEPWSDAAALTARLSAHRRIVGVFCGHIHRSIDSAIGTLPASTVSSIASDVRWDDKTVSKVDGSVLKIHCVSLIEAAPAI